MAGLSIGSCSAVSGFFGMNLLSGVETTAGLFLLVTGTSILLTGSLFVTCWRQFREHPRETHTHQPHSRSPHYPCVRRRSNVLT